jgi:hypothetical protein
MSSATTPLGRRLAILEAEQAAEVAPAAKRWRPPTLVDFVSALSIEDKETGSLIQWRLWPAQRKVLKEMAASDRLYVLKARQLGLSWLSLAFWLYQVNYHGSRSVLIVRQSFSEALDAVHRLKVLHASIPPEFRPQPIVRDNVQSLWFANDSRLEALTATERIARGRAAYGALLDEYCFWDEQALMLNAIEPSCQRLHIVTTGGGSPGDHAHKLWKKASAGKSEWRAVFLPWQSHPLRTAAWHEATVTQAVEPRLARREYAAVPEDAWASPEGIFFERWNPVVNVADVQVSPEMRTVRAVDFGFRSAACLHAQIDSRGQVFVVSEFLPHNLTTEEFADGILQRDRALGVKPAASYVDPAGRAVSVATAQSEVDVFRRMGLHPVSKPSSVRDGCLRLMSAFTDPDLPLVVSRSCPYLIEALSNVKPDRHRGEVYDEGSEYDHVLDSARYLVVNLASKASYTFTPPKYIGAESWEHRLHRLEF